MAVQRHKLVNNQQGPFTHVAVFDYTDIADNLTSSNQVTLWNVPAGGAVECAYVWEETALAGASDITLDVGTTSGDPDEFIDALDVDAMTVPVFNTGDAFSTPEEITGETASSTPVLAEWNGTGGSLTAGRVIIAMTILDPGAIALGPNL
jgi:hypothetical protein